MRILHTSDWHLGALFHDRTRDADEQHALDGVVALARDEAVDVVLIAGDVFDHGNPSADAQRRYYEVLRRLVLEAGVGTVVVIGGNHDSGSRLDGPRELLAGFRLHVRGQLLRTEHASSCLVELVDRGGCPRAVCAAVPYLREADVRALEREESLRELHARQAEALHARFAEIRGAAFERAAGRPVIVMAHCFASGAVPSEDERPVFAERVGKLSQVALAPLAEGASYAALGHLHRPQSLAGRDVWRYSGSLLPNGFDQIAMARSVVVADVPEDGGAATVRLVPLPAFRRYARVEGTLAEVEAAIAALAPNDPDAPRGFLQATVKLDGPRPGVASEIAGWAEARGFDALSIRPSRIEDVASAWAVGDELGGIDTLDPRDVFARLHRQTYQSEPDDELAEAFDALLVRTLARGA